MNAIMKWLRGDSPQETIITATSREFVSLRPVLESLKAYDEGKKNISTSDIRKRFHRLQTTAK